MKGTALVGALVALSLPANGCSRRPVERPEVVALDTNVVNLKVGDIAAVGARALEARRRQPSDPPVVWWSSDSNVATVTDGLVTGVGTGIARAWAKSGKDSAFAVVVVSAKPVRYGIVPTVLAFDALGAVAEVTARPAGAGVVCKSDADSIALVEAGTFVKARGNGTTRVRCRVGDGAGTVQVSVRQQVARISIRSERGLALRPARDTLRLTVARVDRLGQPVTDVRPVWQTLNPAVATIDTASGAVVGVAAGEARIVATVAGLTDTARLQVREDAFTPQPAPVLVRRASATTTRRAGGAAARGGTRAANTAGPGPTTGAARARAATPSAVAIGVRDITPADSVFQAQIAADSAGSLRRLGATLAFGIGEHRVLLDTGDGVRTTSGLMLGADIEGQISRRLLVRGSFLTGTLSSSDVSIPELATGDLQLELDFLAFSWLTFVLGGGYRGYSDAIGAQRWTTLLTGAEARFGLLPDQLEGFVRLALLPVVSVSGLNDSPNLTLRGGAGISYRTGRFALGVEYLLERSDFPTVGGEQRREQLSMLKLRLGLYSLFR